MSDSVCKITSFCVHFFTQLSAWTLAIITVQRSLAIIYPFRCRGIITLRKSAIIYAITAFVIAALGAPHLFLTSISVYNFCGDDDHSNIITYLDMVMSSILPFSLICIFNIWLLISVTKNSKRGWFC